MIRQTKYDCFDAVCSVCKNEVTSSMKTEEAVLNYIKGMSWFIIGKFHFCPYCFSNALDQWKIDNHKLLMEVCEE